MTSKLKFNFNPGDLVKINMTVCEEGDPSVVYAKGTLGLVLIKPSWSRRSEGYLCKILIDGRVSSFNTIFLEPIRVEPDNDKV